MFLLPSISVLPQYAEILTRTQSGDVLLDLGCCFGQDLRLLASDGAPLRNVYASDISNELWNLGFELFKDRDKMPAKFIQANILDPESDLGQLKGRVDLIIANQFLHLFDWNGQIMAMKKIVELSRPGSCVVGYQRSQMPAKVVPGPWGDMYFHDQDSFRKVWQQVESETESEWEVEAAIVDLSEWGMEKEDTDWMPEGRKGINFSAKRRR